MLQTAGCAPGLLHVVSALFGEARRAASGCACGSRRLNALFLCFCGRKQALAAPGGPWEPILKSMVEASLQLMEVGGAERSGQQGGWIAGVACSQVSLLHSGTLLEAVAAGLRSLLRRPLARVLYRLESASALATLRNCQSLPRGPGHDELGPVLLVRQPIPLPYVARLWWPAAAACVTDSLTEHMAKTCRLGALA